MDRTVENLQPETNNEEKADIEEADVKKQIQKNGIGQAQREFLRFQ